MKKFICLAVLSLALTLFASAQNTSNDSKEKYIKHAEKTIRELQVKLQLNDKQKDSLYSALYIKAVLTDSLRNKTTNDPVKKQRLRSVMLIQNTKIDSLLNPEQRKLYAKWKLEPKSK